jgi:hypothetical protein
MKYFSDVCLYQTKNQKIMRTIRFLFSLFLFAGLVSCSDDDDNGGTNSTEANRIVGKWEMQSSSLNGEVIEMGECEELILEFTTNGKVEYTETYEDWETEDCITDTFTEDWEYVGSDRYKFTDEDDFSYIVKVTFTNNNTTFTVTEEDEDGIYSVIFKKI